MLKNLKEDKRQTKREKKRLKELRASFLDQILRFGVFQRRIQLDSQQVGLKQFFFNLWRRNSKEVTTHEIGENPIVKYLQGHSDYLRDV